MMAAPSLRLEQRRRVVLFSALLVCAFLSHTSTFALLSAATFVVAALFLWRGGPAMASPGRAVLLALAVAILLAVVLYYGHFVATYRNELSRIGAETAAGAADAGGRGIGTRLAAVPRYLGLYFGVPILALAGWGAFALWRRGGADRMVLSMSGWAIACLAFLLLGVLTPVDMRYYLAAIPVIALSAAIGAADAWRSGAGRRAAAAVLLAGAVVVGIRGWLGTLGS